MFKPKPRESSNGEGYLVPVFLSRQQPGNGAGVVVQHSKTIRPKRDAGTGQLTFLGVWPYT